MTHDLERLSESIPGFDYREVHGNGGLVRACERWPLLKAVHRALRSERARATAPIPARASADAAALWEE